MRKPPWCHRHVDDARKRQLNDGVMRFIGDGGGGALLPPMTPSLGGGAATRTSCSPIPTATRSSSTSTFPARPTRRSDPTVGSKARNDPGARICRKGFRTPSFPPPISAMILDFGPCPASPVRAPVRPATRLKCGHDSGSHDPLHHCGDYRVQEHCPGPISCAYVPQVGTSASRGTCSKQEGRESSVVGFHRSYVYSNATNEPGVERYA